MTTTTRPRRTTDTARSGQGPGLSVLPECRPPAVSWALRATAPPAQDPLLLRADSAPPDGTAAASHHLRSPWLADPPAGLPDPRRFAGSLVRAMAEVLVGQRPAAQLVRWISEDALATINWRLRTRSGRRRSTSARGRGPHATAPHAAAPPMLRSIRLQLPTGRAVEVAAHLVGDTVPPVIALRLEAHGQRWFCTALELGPVRRPRDDTGGAASAATSGPAGGLSPATGSRSARA